MPRTVMAAPTPTDAGVVLVLVTPDVEGISVPARSVTMIHNTSGAPVTVTAVTPAGSGVPSGLDLADRSLVVPAANTGFMGPFPVEFYGQSGADAGRVFLNFSAVTNVFVATAAVP